MKDLLEKTSGPRIERAPSLLPRMPGCSSVERACSDVRVMHVCLTLEMGGAETLAVQMANDQARRCAHPPLVASIGATDPSSLVRSAIAARVRFEDLKGPAGTALPQVLRLRSLILRERRSVVHAHNAAPLVTSALACAGLQVRLIYTHHGSKVVQAFSHPLLRPYLLRRVSHLVAVSPEAADCLRRSLGGALNGARLHTVLNGVDVDRFSNADPPPAAAPPVIGLVGRLSPEKRVDVAIAALARLRDRKISCQLWLVGNGPLRAQLEQQVETLRLGDRVHFLGLRSDVPALLAQMSVYVNSSATEGISLAILEAMAARCPVVATAVGGTPLLVEDGASGRLIPPGSPEELARALEELLRQPARAADFGERGRETVAARFSFRSMMSQYDTLYAGT